MNQVRATPFGRLDAALLAIVATLAIVAALSADRERDVYGRWVLDPVPATPRFWSWRPDWLQRAVTPVRRVIDVGHAALMVLSLGLAVLGFRPRKGVERGPRGAGQVASAVGSILVVLGLTSIAKDAWIDQPIFQGRSIAWALEDYGHFPPFWYWFDWAAPMTTVASAIAASWIMLAMLGRYRRPVDLHDRLGQWLGWAWIVLAVVTFCFEGVNRG